MKVSKGQSQPEAAFVLPCMVLGQAFYRVLITQTPDTKVCALRVLLERAPGSPALENFSLATRQNSLEEAGWMKVST